MAVLVAAVLAMSASQLFDLATFVAMIGELGPEAEVNPLVSLMFGMYGFPFVAIAKVTLLALVSSIAAILIAKPQRPRLAVGIVALGIVVGLIGGFSNAIALGAI